MDASSIDVITNFAVVLAGFTGIVVAVAHQNGAFVPLDRFRNFTMLLYSLGAGFGSLIPLVAESFGVFASDMWRISNLAFCSVLLFGIFATLKGIRQLNAEDQIQLSNAMKVLVFGGNGILIVWLLVNSFGTATPGPLLVALIWQLAISSILFVRLVLSSRL